MKNTITTLLGSALLATGIASAQMAPANAATVACSSTVTNTVTGISECQVSTTADQDFLNTNPMTVNAEAFFGFTDWAFATKTDLPDNRGQSGAWDISSVFQSTWNDVMLVFKSGNNTFLTGFMVQDGVTSGSWMTPFLNKDVSHISVYYRTGADQPPVSSVPEPATLMGLGLVASGMIVSRRRKASQSA